MSARCYRNSPHSSGLTPHGREDQTRYMRTIVFRFVIVPVVMMLGWSLWPACMDARAPDQVAVGAPAEGDCPPNVGLDDCCTTIQPFVAVKKLVVPQLEFAALHLAATSAPPTLESLSLYLPIGLLDPSPPPGGRYPTFLTLSILRI